MSTPPREELARRLAAQAEAGDEDENVAPRDQEKTPEPEVDEGDDLKATLALSKDALAALLEKVRKAPAAAAPPAPSGTPDNAQTPDEPPPPRAQDKRKT